MEEWSEHLEAFVRFMTMEPSAVTRIDCHLGGSGNQRQDVELIAPRVQRDDRTAEQGRSKPFPYDYLATLHALQQCGIDLADVFAGYWQRTVTGDAYMAMQLHLESQDRLLDRSSDSALLNAIRSVESPLGRQQPWYRASSATWRRAGKDRRCHSTRRANRNPNTRRMARTEHNPSTATSRSTR